MVDDDQLRGLIDVVVNDRLVRTRVCFHSSRYVQDRRRVFMWLCAMKDACPSIIQNVYWILLSADFSASFGVPRSVCPSLRTHL